MERREAARGMVDSTMEAGGWSGAFGECVRASYAGSAGPRPQPPKPWREPPPVKRHPVFEQDPNWPEGVEPVWSQEDDKWVPMGTVFVFGYVRVELSLHYAAGGLSARPVVLDLRCGQAEGRKAWESIGADCPHCQEEFRLSGLLLPPAAAAPVAAAHAGASAGRKTLRETFLSFASYGNDGEEDDAALFADAYWYGADADAWEGADVCAYDM